MTKLLLIRHGEPNYDEVTKRKYKGHGRDLGSLSENGINQAKMVSKDSRLLNAEIIISSPYTRTLQTAAIISKELCLDIIVENDIHEWMPDLSFNYLSDEEVKKAGNELKKYHGEYPEGKVCSWEPLSCVAKRSIECLKKYTNYEKIIVVTHGIVMRQFKFKEKIAYCEVLEVDFDENFRWSGWINI